MRDCGKVIRPTLIIIFILASSLLVGDVSAQSFGKNKVQYRKHEFRILQTEHFDIYFHQDRREPVDLAGRMAERWWHRLSRFFGQELSGRQPIVLYSSKPDFDQTLIVSGLIDGGTAGVTEPWRRRIALPFAPSLADTDHVLGHEIVHAFQFDLASGQGSSGAGELPLWAIEGLAEYLTLGAVETHTAMWLRDAVRHNRLPSVDDLVKPEYFPYRWGHAFWAFVGGRWGEQVAADLYRTAALYGIHAAIESVLAMTTDEFSATWRDALRAAYPPNPGPALGTQVAGPRPLDGTINVGAALSPDGRWLAYLTERLFSVDLVVADAGTGKVAATLTDTAADPRYSSLQYVGSAAAWDAKGERLAISTLTSGRPALSIFRWPGGGLEKDVVIDGVDEVFGPTWSPDGRMVAFSAMSQGTTDLFAFDLQTSKLRKLTDDVYADLQPAWSPDGRSLAFITDRFTTDLRVLTAGAYRVATIDIASGTIRPVQGFAKGKHIAPQWARDSRAIYFVSDADGTPDVYKVDLASGALARLTNAESGIAGLTGSSPALSVAAGADTAAVTVYEGGVFAIHVVALSGGAPAARDTTDAPRLPGADGSARSRTDVDELIAVAAAPPEPFPIEPYRAKLQLEDISQPSFSAGADLFGATAAGGVGLAFSDMLHTHWLVTTIQVGNPIGANASWHDIAGSLGYSRQSGRLQWGVAGHAFPTYLGIRGTSLRSSTPFTLVRQVERAMRGGGAYPLSRARRLEFSGGVIQMELDELAGLFGSWQSAADPMTLGSTSLAFVSDTAYSGPTSAISGERYRLEAAPVFGTLQYLNLTADYRRYFMPTPFFTIAGRAMHIGRYGSGADDPRLPPMYLGYPWLIRGLDSGWQVVNECVTILASECPDVDNLIGSRVAVGNLELRIPILRPFGLSRSMYGPIPVELAAFVDGGLAWKGAEALRGRSRTPVWSTGLTFRSNVAGLGITQIDIARPFSQPQSGWVFQFHLAPAF